VPRLIHLSDLHFGAHDERLVEAVATRIDEDKPDLVVASGDFTQRARTEQFQEACRFLGRLRDAGHEVLAVPGNHDIPLYDVFRRVGTGLGIPDLPRTYAEWRLDRELHLRRDLVQGKGTDALYAQYRKHLGPWRYHLLLRLQAILTPGHVRGLLRLKGGAWLRPLLRFYPVLVRAGLRSIIQRLLMPSAYLEAARGLDCPAGEPSRAAQLCGVDRSGLHSQGQECSGRVGTSAWTRLVGLSRIS